MTQEHTDFAAGGPLAIPGPQEEGCSELRLLMRRRDLLGLSVGLFTAAFLPRRSYAADSVAGPKRLLIVLLRGGLDGLNVLPPKRDNYARARGSLALDLASQIALPQYPDYCLNANMPVLGGMLNNASDPSLGRARLVLPIAPPLQTRSHFDCSFNLENGTAESARSENGWLNRLFGLMSDTQKTTLGSYPLQVGNTPVILTGSEPVLSWSPLIYKPDFFARDTAKQGLRTLYQRTAGAQTKLRGNDVDLATTLDEGLRADSYATAITTNDPVGRAFSGAAQLMSAANGPRIAVVTVDNFDTHVGTDANSSRVLKRFDNAFEEFRKVAQKTGIWDQSLIVAVSEFGRSVTDHAIGGSDHGVGGVAFLAGGAVRTSGIVGQWPDLITGATAGNNDIPALYDTRDLFRAVLRDHMQITDGFVSSDVFPGLKSTLKGSQLQNILG